MSEESAQLSDREQEILQHISRGATNQQIANELGISINTVKVHVRNIFSKIGVSSRTEATVYAMRSGLVSVAADPPDARESAPATVMEAPPMSVDTSPIPAPASNPAPTEDEPPAAPVENRATVPTPSAATHSGRPLVLVAVAIGGVLLGAALIWFLSGNQPALPVATPSITLESTPVASAPDNRAQPQPTWSSLSVLPAALQAAAAVSLEGSIFVIGGQTANGPTGAIWRYDPDSNTWRALDAKPTPVSQIHAVALNGQLYVPGGQQADNTLTNVVEVYDPVRGTWRTVAPLPAPRSAYSLVVLEGRIYLLGGWDGSTARAEVYVYDPGSDSWATESTMPIPRAYGGAVVADGKIYVVGGENETGTLQRSEIYAPAREGGTWTATTAPLPQPRSRFALDALANFIILMGGLPESNPLLYNIRTDTWETFEQPPGTALMQQPAVAQRDASLFVLTSDPATQANSNLFELRMLYTVAVPLR